VLTAAPRNAIPATTSRRVFVGTLLAAAAAVLGGAATRLGLVRSARARPRRVSLPEPTADGISFHGEVILVRSGVSVRALSARCTHLGCRLNQVERDMIVCACHGSRFDDAGRVVRGPAALPLAALVIEATAGTGRLDVIVAD